MHRKPLAVVLIALLMNTPLLVAGQTRSVSEVKVNMPAPELRLEKLFQAPGEAKADWSSLKGKVVVLDFWATWCAPCIATMPHLINLVEKFKAKPIQFIAVTDENESTVTDFLKQRTLKAWVGLDTDRSAFEAYGVRGIPYTVIVDRDGKIATITRPKNLTETMLSEILAGRSVNVAKERSDTPSPKPPTPDDVPARFTLTIKPAKSASSFWSRGPGKFQARAIDVKTLLGLLHNVRRTRIISPTLLEDARYDVLALMPDGTKGDLDSILTKAVVVSFELKICREMRETDVFVLTVPEQAAIKLKPNSSEVGHSSDDAGVIAASAVPTATLAVQLEDVLKQPVVDETKLQGKYNYNLVFDEKNPSSIIDAARKELGLELIRVKKQVEFLIVEME